MQGLMTRYGWDKPLFPMGAKDSGDKLEALCKDPNYIAERKWNGFHFLSINNRFFSRTASAKDGMPVEKTDNIPHIVQILQKELPPDIIFAGEIYFPHKKAKDVTAIMGCKPEKAIERQANNKIRYGIFDLLQISYGSGNRQIKSLMGNAPWEMRRALLENIYSSYLAGNPYIDLSEVVWDNQMQALEKIWAEGDEGMVFKNINGLYLPGKRPEGNQYKAKPCMTVDAVIMGYEAGKGKFNGLIGAVMYGMYKDGVLTPAGACGAMTDDVRADLTAHQEEYIGRVIEVEGMERTEDGKLLHPRYNYMRIDKAPEQCLWD